MHPNSPVPVFPLHWKGHPSLSVQPKVGLCQITTFAGRGGFFHTVPPSSLCWISLLFHLLCRNSIELLYILETYLPGSSCAMGSSEEELRSPHSVALFLPSRATVLHLRLTTDQRCSTAPWAGRHRRSLCVHPAGSFCHSCNQEEVKRSGETGDFQHFLLKEPFLHLCPKWEGWQFEGKPSL